MTNSSRLSLLEKPKPVVLDYEFEYRGRLEIMSLSGNLHLLEIRYRKKTG